MTCSGRYAEAIDFATTFCVERLLAGTDQGANPAHATITDAAQNFVTQGMKVGSPVYNVTSGVYGKVTNVSATILQVSGVTFLNGDSYIALPIAANEVASIEHFLNIAAGSIHVARQAANACTCSLSAGAVIYLRDLNAVIAAVRHNCSCGGTGLSDSMRQSLLMHVNEQLRLIRTGEIELCEGYAGKDYPAWGAVEFGWTPDTEANIVYNRERRDL